MLIGSFRADIRQLALDNILGVKRYFDNTEPRIMITLHVHIFGPRDNDEMIQQFSPGSLWNRFSLTKNSSRDTNGGGGHQC